ncbi:hypothetical protein FUAX_37940 [Fulvitalea axinellae]|uniref:N-acetylglucosamine kinase n=1 Tax=Fulvitalea axinellae TaxID=1182444 RepID=A0AAU9D0Z8_9BACT|nr:hypothetical protein FUAX_37940 [Fulvitalea axinellae]
MKVIADSGSSKTLWRVYANQRLSAEIKTQGLNPGGMELRDFEERMTGFDYWSDSIQEVYFYGAGCVGQGKVFMEEALAKKFPKAQITVENDLLGAARSLYGNEPGYVGILGTGSNACFYDGENLIRRRGGHGYLLSDEGGGYYLGRQLLADYMNGQIPEDLRELLERAFGLNPQNLVAKVYGAFQPNRYVAGFSLFVKDNIGHPYLQRLVAYGFRDYFKTTFANKSFYAGDYPVRFIGSVAVAYEDILREVAVDFDIVVKTINRDPMSGLELYHNCVNLETKHEHD